MHNELTENTHHHESDSTDVLGFWLYLMTDCILFATLFATFAVLSYQSMSITELKKYIELPVVFTETLFLLASNFTYCLAMLSLYKNKIKTTQIWLLITFLLGASFILLEIKEFMHLAASGFRWDYSGEASAFFSLVGTHGFHVSCGLLWILIMIAQLFFIKSPTVILRRMTYLGLFWNFLDIVWIFVFTVVYLMGAVA